MPSATTAPPAATASAFHRGERDVQTRAGSRQMIEAVGRRMIRDFMPEQHRLFFPTLPFIVVGAIDADGAPAATLLAATAPGFVHSPDPRRLRIEALPIAGDPLAAGGGSIRPGAPIGLLGIELPTRRRNRANGRVASVDERGFDIDVQQSFGNCPKYIQTRELRLAAPTDATPGPVRTTTGLDAEAASLIRRADTFFIATSTGALASEGASSDTAPSAFGVDVSHRGGRPGFVHVDIDANGAGTLTWPDFAGNQLFQTLGNLAVFPRAGLVFPDFDTGDLLHVTGRAEIVWDGPDVDGFAGAERLVRLHVERAIRRPAALPWRGRLVEPSPALEGTGCW